MCLDINISLKLHLSSAIGHPAPLTVMFYYFTSATYSYRVARCYSAMGLRCHHISPLHRSNGDAVFIVVIWYTTNLRLTSTYPRKTTRPYASYARITHLLLYAYRLYPPSLHQYPTYKRKASGKAGQIGFIFNSARCVNRPVSMINTAKIAITQQRMNRIKWYMLATSLTLPTLATAMISK